MIYLPICSHESRSQESGLNPSLLPGQGMFKFISIKETIVGNGNNVFIFLILCVKCAMCMHVFMHAISWVKQEVA